MKSIRYILSGRCRTFHDCLHRSRLTPPLEISVQLDARENPTDILCAVQMLSAITWRFPDQTLTLHRLHGQFDADASETVKRAALARANLRLARDVERMNAISPSVTVSPPNYDHVLWSYSAPKVSDPRVKAL